MREKPRKDSRARGQLAIHTEGKREGAGEPRLARGRLLHGLLASIELPAQGERRYALPRKLACTPAPAGHSEVYSRN